MNRILGPAGIKIRALTPIIARSRWHVLLFLSSCIYLLAFHNVVNMDPDEGIVLQGAHRILAGQVPYRDFFTFYTPGSFYFTAALFRIFGDSILTARSALVFFGASFTVIAYALVRRTCTNTVAWFTAVLVLTTSTPYRFLVLHNWDSTFWTCLGAYGAVRWSETGKWLWAFATGTFASFTFLSEQSKGAGFYAGILIAILVLAGCKRPLNSLRALIFGTLWPFLLVLIFFACKHSLHAMLAAWIWPLTHYSLANHVAYGDQSWPEATRNELLHEGPLAIRIIEILALSTGFVVPILPLVGVMMLFYCARRLRPQQDTCLATFVLLSSVVCGLLISVILVRPDINHFMYLSPLFYVVLAWILDANIFRGSLTRALRPILQLYTIAAFGLLATSVLFTALSAQYRITTRRGDIRSRGHDTVLEYLQAHTTPGQRLLVYPYLPLYNYLTATISPSHLDYFQPGMNTPEQGLEIIYSLQSQNIESVLLEPSFADKIPSSWPNTPLSAIANNPVADYILLNYHSCRFLNSPMGWQLEFMVEKKTACP